MQLSNSLWKRSHQFESWSNIPTVMTVIHQHLGPAEYSSSMQSHPQIAMTTNTVLTYNPVLSSHTHPSEGLHCIRIHCVSKSFWLYHMSNYILRLTARGNNLLEFTHPQGVVMGNTRPGRRLDCLTCFYIHHCPSVSLCSVGNYFRLIQCWD